MSSYVLGREWVDLAGPVRTAVDIFSGAGGIALGLVNAGYDVRLCSDLSEACEATHHRDLPDIALIRCDIHDLCGADVMKAADLGPGELDLLIGGPPCRGLSIMGRRQLRDPRNGLFRQFNGGPDRDAWR